MSRYNNYFANGFASCLCIAHARDPHRERDVRLYRVPGETETVGVTDGVDVWIAPVTASLFNVNIEQIMRDISAGKKLDLPILGAIHQKRARRRLIEDAANGPPEEPEPLLRRPTHSQAHSRIRKTLHRS